MGFRDEALSRYSRTRGDFGGDSIFGRRDCQPFQKTHGGHRFGLDLSGALSAAQALQNDASHSPVLVRAFQSAYNAAGGQPPIAVDGAWGPETAGALAGMGLASSAPQTLGQNAPASLGTLAPDLNSAAKTLFNDAARPAGLVTAFQSAYNAAGLAPSLAVDGVWGPKTAAALAQVAKMGAQGFLPPPLPNANAPTLHAAVPAPPAPLVPFGPIAPMTWPRWAPWAAGAAGLGLVGAVAWSQRSRLPSLPRLPSFPYAVVRRAPRTARGR